MSKENPEIAPPPEGFVRLLRFVAVTLTSSVSNVAALFLILGWIGNTSAWADPEPQWSIDDDLGVSLMSPSTDPLPPLSRVEIRITTEPETSGWLFPHWTFGTLADIRKWPLSYATENPGEIKVIVAALRQTDKFDGNTALAINQFIRYRTTRIRILLFSKVEGKYASGTYCVGYVNGVPKGLMNPADVDSVYLNQAFCNWLKQHKLVPGANEQ
jgi:hypothetical protein